MPQCIREKEDMKITICSRIDHLKDTLLDIARYIYDNPEPSFQEHRAVAILTKHLAEVGFHISRPIAGLETAYAARLDCGSEGPTVAMLSQYDAIEGVGHVCGHHLIASGALGAAMALSTLADELCGTILQIGCPAEEGGGGKVIMVDGGAFDDIDATLMFHPYDRTVVMNTYHAQQSLEFTFHGKAAHAGGAPEEGINALDGVLSTFNAINALREHVPSDIRMHGIVTNGGQAFNVVPELAACKFGLRASTIDGLNDVVDKVQNIAKGAALQTGTKVVIEKGAAYYNMVNNRRLGEILQGNLERLDVHVDAFEEESTASTDYGNVSYVVPSVYPTFDIGAFPHSEDFQRASISPEGLATMILAGKALAMTVIDLLFDGESVEAIGSEFRRSVAGES